MAEKEEEDIRAQYVDSGEWARHFSVVRMTLSTFFVTAAWGFVAFKWDDYEDALYWAAWGAWILAGVFLVGFSILEGRSTIFQRRCKNALSVVPGGSERKGSSSQIKKAWRGITQWLPIWGPFAVYLVMTGGFLRLLCAWEQREGHPAVQWVAVANSASMGARAKDSKAPVTSVDWEALVAGVGNQKVSGNSPPDLLEISAGLKRIEDSMRTLEGKVQDCCGKHSPPPHGAGPTTPFGEGVVGIQKALVLVGCDPRGVDGRLGPKTRRAAKRFCKDGDLCTDYDDPRFIPALIMRANEECAKNR